MLCPQAFLLTSECKKNGLKMTEICDLIRIFRFRRQVYLYTMELENGFYRTAQILIGSTITWPGYAILSSVSRTSIKNLQSEDIPCTGMKERKAFYSGTTDRCFGTWKKSTGHTIMSMPISSSSRSRINMDHTDTWLICATVSFFNWPLIMAYNVALSRRSRLHLATIIAKNLRSG